MSRFKIGDTIRVPLPKVYDPYDEEVLARAMVGLPPLEEYTEILVTQEYLDKVVNNEEEVNYFKERSLGVVDNTIYVDNAVNDDNSQ